MYTFKEVNREDVDEFASDNGIFFQTSNWSDFRSLFRTSAFLGYDGDEVVLSCMVFLLPVYMTPYKVAYITRGFVCDYNNKELVAQFTEFLKVFMKKRHIVYLIFDPHCDYKVDFKDPAFDINEYFLSLGYEKNNGIKLQPHTNYRLNINSRADKEVEKNRLYSSFAQRLKNDIKISSDRGVTLEKVHCQGLDRAVEIFYDLLLKTTEIKGFGHRNLEYYKNFAKSLEEYVTIYLYKYDSAKDILYTENVIKDVEAQLKKYDDEIADPNTTDKKRERLYPKRKEALKQLDATKKRLEISKEHTDNPYISAYFYIKMGNKAYNFYGANSPILRKLKLTANYWDMIQDSIDGKVETFNMGGTLKLNSSDIKHDAMYELYQYKCQYGGEFVEMPGEYYLISNRKLFDLFHNKLNYFRRIVFRF